MDERITRQARRAMQRGEQDLLGGPWNVGARFHHALDWMVRLRQGGSVRSCCVFPVALDSQQGV